MRFSPLITVLFGLLCMLPAQQPQQPPSSPQAPSEAAPQAPAQAPQPPQPRQLIRADLGIDFAVITSKLRRNMIRTSTPYGFAVRSVAKDSLADKAGIARGTIVLEVDGKPLREVAELAKALQQAAPGQKLVLKCSRRKANAGLLDRKPWEDFEAALVLPAVKDADQPGVEKPKRQANTTRRA